MRPRARPLLFAAALAAAGIACAQEMGPPEPTHGPTYLLSYRFDPERPIRCRTRIVCDLSGGGLAAPSRVELSAPLTLHPVEVDSGGYSRFRTEIGPGTLERSGTREEFASFEELCTTGPRG